MMSAAGLGCGPHSQTLVAAAILRAHCSTDEPGLPLKLFSLDEKGWGRACSALKFIREPLSPWPVSQGRQEKGKCLRTGANRGHCRFLQTKFY